MDGPSLQLFPAAITTAPLAPPSTFSPAPNPPASPPLPARPQRLAATRARIFLSASSNPLSFSSSSSSSSDTDADTAASHPHHANSSAVPVSRPGSTATRDTGDESAYGTARPSDINTNTAAGPSAAAGLVDSDNDSDGYIAIHSTRRSAKRKHPGSACGRRKMLRLDRDDWKVIAGANGGNDVDGNARKRKKKKKEASTPPCGLSREEMKNLLGFVSGEVDWEKAAVSLGGGEDGAVGKGKGESAINGTGDGELQSADGDGYRRSAKSAAELQKCWNGSIRMQLLKICNR